MIGAYILVQGANYLIMGQKKYRWQTDNNNNNNNNETLRNRSADSVCNRLLVNMWWLRQSRLG